MKALARRLATLRPRLADAEAECGAAYRVLDAEPMPQRRHDEMPVRPGVARYGRAFEARDQLRHQVWVLEAAERILSTP